MVSSWSILSVLVSSAIVSALPFPFRAPTTQRRNIQLPFQRRSVVKSLHERDDGLAGTVGIGDLADLFYTVAVKVGGTTTSVNLDTGSSDLWVMSSQCTTKECKKSQSQSYPATSGKTTGASVDLRYGDSTTGTHASGPIMQDTVAVAGLSMASQVFAAANNTDSSAVQNGGAGIFGLGFPAQSFVQAAVVNQMFNTPTTTDDFVNNIISYGPLVSRLAMSGEIEEPMFAITLQRNTIDVSGTGQISIGELPQGVDNSSLTWVPVRLYDPADGGLNPPSFASNEVYPLRWEIPLDAVYLDGQKLPDTTLTGSSSELSALIDTGNSILRGPQDVVNNILSAVSPARAADSSALPTFPCTSAHSLSFQIGGKMFPIDPRDFVSQNNSGDATTCVASNVVATDAPSAGALFSWSLGDPFFKSNLVVFYYGNLTHPSLDPPRIGFLSTVPQNASALLQSAVADAQSDGGVFESTVNAAPTVAIVSTVTGVEPTSAALVVSATVSSTPTHTSTTAAQGSANAAASTSALPSATPSANQQNANSAAASCIPAISLASCYAAVALFSLLFGFL